MIEITNFLKIIGQQTMLDIPHFVQEDGEITAIVGSPGSGKEDLWDHLTGKTHPSAGTIRVAGIDPFDEKKAFSRSVGVLFPEDALYKRQSPLGNLDLQCKLYGLPKARAFSVLDQIGLADQANIPLDKLASPLLRRLAFGRSFLHKPDVLLLYEPYARCDEVTISLLSKVIRELAIEGTTILILAGDTAHLGSLCDKIYHIQQGHLSVESQNAEENQPSRPFKIPVKLGEKVILVTPADILFIEAEGGHTCLHTIDARLTTQFTVNELEERLSRSGFFRAHRSYLVNLQHIKEIIPYTRNSFSLRLDDPAGTEIPLSKMAAGELKELFGY
ncbi:MAG: ATP-binding cassette domain-containing protein [Chloroflexi bacterium]|nr:MAG: ATP-binding cassette domain-containing protein [Chloroflexota bacterium]